MVSGVHYKDTMRLKEEIINKGEYDIESGKYTMSYQDDSYNNLLDRQRYIFVDLMADPDEEPIDITFDCWGMNDTSTEYNFGITLHVYPTYASYFYLDNITFDSFSGNIIKSNQQFLYDSYISLEITQQVMDSIVISCLQTIDACMPEMGLDITLVDIGLLAEDSSLNTGTASSQTTGSLSGSEQDAASVISGDDNASDTASTRGTLQNPYSASEGAVLEFNKYSFYPVREVSVKCIDMIRGDEANRIVKEENMFNDEPSSSTEWVLMEFELQFISSDEANDSLEASDILFMDDFFSDSGASLTIHDTATLSHELDGYSIYDVELYPGSTGKVWVGLLIDKEVNDILLRVPYNESDSNSWINCSVQ